MSGYIRVTNWRETRLAVFERDGYRCLYCRKKFKAEDLHVDHIYPRAEGGGNEWWNLATACGSCNMSKGAKVYDWSVAHLERNQRQDAITDAAREESERIAREIEAELLAYDLAEAV